MKFDEEKKYYVYVWFYKENDKVFYVGKGCKYRYRSRKRDNEILVNIINSNDCDSKIIVGNLSEKEAFELEEYYIDYYRKNNHPLINIQDGGYKPPNHQGKKHTEISKQKASISMKNFYDEHPERKKESSEKMKAFFQTDEGKEFQKKSIESRRTENFRKEQSLRSRKANNTKEYIERQSQIIKNIWERQDYKDKHTGSNNHASQFVQQFDLDGNLIAEYETVTEASKITGVNGSKISAVARGHRKTAGGFIWKYPNPKDLHKKNTRKYDVKKDKCAKPIYQCDLKGNIIREYNSINEATDLNGFPNRTNIICNLKGRTKSAYGYIWKYK